MKKFFNLFVKNFTSKSGASWPYNDYVEINIGLVKYLNRKENLLTLFDGCQLVVETTEVWSELLGAIDGTIDDNPFGPDHDTEIRDAVDAGLWREFIKQAGNFDISIGVINVGRVDRLVLRLKEAENIRIANAYGDADFEETNRKLAEQFRIAQKLIKEDSLQSNTGLWSGFLIDRLKVIFK